MKMFLSSSFADVIDLFSEFIHENPRGKVVTFIPTASTTEAITHYVDSAIAAFNDLGITIEMLDLSKCATSEIEEKLSKNDYIYVSGGNTFYLLQELRKTGSDKLIIDQIKKGKLYIGESAGSIIMAPDIEYVAFMDDKTKASDLTRFTGLNLIRQYPIPHSGNKYFNEAVKKIIECHESKLDLLPFTDDQALLISNDDLIVR
ncbi:Type 1 glutamine amidotransferase-like domain-containing protein [Shouchella hunanensis]|uniref:Type 1 glutamine amidotransferase-like domain-containing protein n=1 Tax=Shouchella hunanensis TaxID=766894 RepID=A0ABY7W5Q0_9BACI|nr:Type 1 glutamine amidotransferase-like domain-containing protein [Shouchella hunanensis]WDF03406.1 Type 1 glutamine amidotransferase-like domain-containing protein [Shouchella hunanensis]GAF23985.1 alpha-aspartyl dipeptidase peptidase E [Bacillus sp. JCM 19047]